MREQNRRKPQNRDFYEKHNTCNVTNNSFVGLYGGDAKYGTGQNTL